MPPATTVDGIRVIAPVFTIVDLAAHLDKGELTRALNEADRLTIVDPDELASLVESLRNRRGIRGLRSLLCDYTRTDSDLERQFLALVKRAGLPRPRTSPTTALHPSKRRTAGATRSSRPPAFDVSVSRTPRCARNRTKWPRR